jgi:hypothetical protein
MGRNNLCLTDYPVEIVSSLIDSIECKNGVHLPKNDYVHDIIPFFQRMHVIYRK